MANIFLDIGLMIIIATAFAYILRFFNQPLIPGYILAGILIGPIFGLTMDAVAVSHLSEIGIAFLLFIVGLELDIKKLRDIGGVATIGALAQIFILFGVGYLVSVWLGFSSIIAIHLGLILAFSSTMVVIKLLSDKHELDTLHGRIVIGILLMQDIVAIVAITVLRDLANFAFIPFLFSAAQAVGLLLIAVILAKYVFPSVFKFAARHQELLFLASLSVCFAFSILFHLINFSIAIGAFIAGIALGNLPYNIEIVGKVKSLRDFFAVFFFTAIGAELVFVDFSLIAWPMLIFFLFTILLLPIITIIIAILFGYKSRTAFMTGISLAQISEFGLIIAMQGRNIIGEEVFAMVILLTLATMATTSYFIKYDSWLYKHIGIFFKRFEGMGKVSRELSLVRQDKAHDYILIGLDRMGYSIYNKLKKMHKDVVVVDFNPDIIKKLMSKHVPCVYGDIADIEVVEKLRLSQVKMLISTIPEHNDNLFLIQQVKKHNHKTTLIMTSYSFEDALDLYEAGADYVIVPHYLGGQHMSVLLEDISDNLEKLLTTKLEHIRDLRHRQVKHPHHR